MSWRSSANSPREVARYFADPATTGLESLRFIDKDHGRIETRTHSVHGVDWLGGERRYPDEPRFPSPSYLVRTTRRIIFSEFQLASFQGDP